MDIKKIKKLTHICKVAAQLKRLRHQGFRFKKVFKISQHVKFCFYTFLVLAFSQPKSNKRKNLSMLKYRNLFQAEK